MDDIGDDNQNQQVSPDQVVDEVQPPRDTPSIPATTVREPETEPQDDQEHRKEFEEEVTAAAAIGDDAGEAARASLSAALETAAVADEQQQEQQLLNTQDRQSASSQLDASASNGSHLTPPPTTTTTVDPTAAGLKQDGVVGDGAAEDTSTTAVTSDTAAQLDADVLPDGASGQVDSQSKDREEVSAAGEVDESTAAVSDDRELSGDGADNSATAPAAGSRSGSADSSGSTLSSDSGPLAPRPASACPSRVNGMTLAELVMMAEDTPWRPTLETASAAAATTGAAAATTVTATTTTITASAAAADVEPSLIASRDMVTPTEPITADSNRSDSPQSVTAHPSAAAATTPLPTLPPDHPLMARFQRALANFLRKQLEEADNEMKQLEAENARVSEEVISQGERQYHLQEQLKLAAARQHSQQQQLSDISQRRTAADDKLKLLKTEYEQLKQQLVETEKNECELRDELDRLASHQFHLQWLQSQSESRLRVGQTMTDRSGQQLLELARDKQFQSYLAGRVESQVTRLEERIKRSQTQRDEQRAELQQVRQLLDSTAAELELLEMEKAHLKNVWIKSMETMQKKDRTLADLRDKASELSTEVHSVSVEVISLQRTINDTQTENETLTAQLHVMQMENSRLDSEHDKQQQQLEQLQHQLSKKQQQLKLTETQIVTVQTEQSVSERQLQQLQQQVDQCQVRRRAIEDQVDTALHQRLAASNAHKNATGSISQLRAETRLLENRLNTAENEASQLLLAISGSSASLQHLEATLTELSAETHLVEQNVNRFEREVEHNNWSLQQKLGRIQTLDKKLASLIEAAGGRELGPLELHITALQKSLLAAQNQLRDSQLAYTRQHAQLLEAVDTRDQLRQQLQRLNKELLVMEERKQRLETSIDGERRSLAHLERNVARQRRAICHLSGRLVDEKSDEQRRTSDVQLAHSRLCESVQDMELECVKIREEVAQAEQQRQQLADQLVSNSQLQLLWQQKLQLLREAQQKLHAQDGVLEQVAAMKAEIHRMEVRLQQLQREQEQLMTDMERAVERRENMTIRSRLQQQQQQRQLAANSRASAASACQAAQHTLAIKRQLTQARKDVSHMRCELQLCEKRAEQLSTDQLARQSQLQLLAQTVHQLERRLALLKLQKQQNLAIIVLKQRVAKQYRQLADGGVAVAAGSDAVTPPPPAHSPPDQLQEEEELEQREQQLVSVLEQLTQQQPELQQLLAPLCQLLST